MSTVAAISSIHDLPGLLHDRVDTILVRLVEYAKQTGYAQYTSTLPEAWRLSVDGLNSAIEQAVELYGEQVDFGPDTDFSSDPVCSFAMQEARLHRERGITLEMFLGLMKYYAQTYDDVLVEYCPGHRIVEEMRRYVARVFDRIEIAFTREWSSLAHGVLISELQSRNRELTNEKNLYLAVVESLAEPVAIFRADGSVRHLNRAAMALMPGAGEDPGNYYTGLGNTQLFTQLYARFRGGGQAPELVMLEVNGRERIFELRLSDVVDVSEKFTGSVMYLHDVTTRQQTLAEVESQKEEIQIANAELEALLQKTTEMQDQLLQSEKLASIGQLAAGVAHEINNPVGFVKSNLGTLSEYVLQFRQLVDQLSEKVADRSEVAAIQEASDYSYICRDVTELLHESLDGVARVQKIVADLKNYARPDSGEDFDWLDLNEVVRSTLNIVWNELKYKADVVTEFADLPRVRANTVQINQILVNLLVNAAQAIERQGTITVTTRLEESGVAVDVSDTGIGIQPETQSRLFDPFFTTKPMGKGTGLGLAISQKLAAKHYGRIAVRSEPGAGSTFTLHLPLDPATGSNQY